MSTPATEPLDLHPHDADAEKAVLGSLLIDNEVLPDVASVLGRGAFYVERHRLIFDAIQHVYDAGGPVDLVTQTDCVPTPTLVASPPTTTTPTAARRGQACPSRSAGTPRA